MISSRRLCLIVLPFFWALISHGADRTLPKSFKMYHNREGHLDLDALSSASLEGLGSIPFRALSEINATLALEVCQSSTGRPVKLDLLRIAGVSLPLGIGFLLGRECLMDLTGAYLGALFCVPVSFYISSVIRDHEKEVKERHQTLRSAYDKICCEMGRRKEYSLKKN
jgi:hypothetical protein